MRPMPMRLSRCTQRIEEIGDGRAHDEGQKDGSQNPGDQDEQDQRTDPEAQLSLEASSPVSPGAGRGSENGPTAAQRAMWRVHAAR